MLLHSAHNVQLIGTFGIALFAVLLIMISTEVRWFTRYGREAVACAGGYLLSVAVVRMLALFDVVTQVDAREINGMIVFIYLAIMLQVWILHRREKQVLRRANP